MKRNTVVKRFIELLNEDDFLIVAGEGLCCCAYKYDRPGILYFPKDTDVFSFAFGISNGVKRRVYLLCEDAHVLKYLSSLANAGVSRKQNLYIAMIGSGIYQDEGGTFTIFDSLKSDYNLFYSLGYTVHNYKKFFKERTIIAKENNRHILNFATGPVFIILEADKDLLKEDFNIDLKKNFYDGMSFIRQTEV